MHYVSQRIAASVGALLVVVGSASAGAPLKGIDVKLGKNSGGSVASRVTDSTGAFTFGVLAKGRYRLTFSFPKGAVPASGFAEVTVTGAANGPLDAKIVMPESGAAATRAADISTIDFLSDGAHPVRGSVQLTTKDGSNGYPAHMAVKGSGVSGGSIPTGGGSGPTKPACAPYPGRPCP